jgi:hypothetical protein
MIAKYAIASAIPRLLALTTGRIDIYIRRIDRSSGTDEAAVADYHVPPLVACGSNPFDQRCRLKHDASIATAEKKAARIRAEIRELNFPVDSLGTSVDGAFAAAGSILHNAPGQRWLIVASDLRTVSAKPPPPAPRIELGGVHVVVVFSCREALALCQTRQSVWVAKLKKVGAADVRFLTPQQGDSLFRFSSGG